MYQSFLSERMFSIVTSSRGLDMYNIISPRLCVDPRLAKNFPPHLDSHKFIVCMEEYVSRLEEKGKELEDKQKIDFQAEKFRRVTRSSSHSTLS